MDDENSKTIKNKILTRLIFNYVFYENYYMIPWFLVLSIHYSIYNEDKTIKRSDFFFKSFFDNDFISYYSKLIEQMKEGDFDSKNSLEIIKDKYKKEKLIIKSEFIEEYSSSLNKIIIKNSQMISHVSLLNNILNEINRNIKYIEMKYGQYKLENIINEFKIEIDLYKSKIISFF